MPQHLRAFDLALVAAYLIGITLFGLRFRKKSGADKSLKSYFLADNTIPWWAIALSIVSAETSTLTIISVPGLAFAGDFGFLQIVLGYMLGRIVVAGLFLPRYFAGNMLTAYQLIDQRFGPVLHKVTAGLFLLTRAAAEGVRVFAVSIVLGIAIGTGDALSIGIISALTLLYTFEGGMAAVIWTDVVQMAIYIGGTAVAIWSLGHHIAGGWSHIYAVANAANKFHLFHFALNLTTAYTFWAGVLGGTFLTMASHGTDQLMVQRMLAARSLRESQLALLSSGVVIFIQFTLFLFIGAGLYVFYGQHPAAFASSDRIFPTFIVREMPLGIAGLLVAAILAAAMSNLSAALNSLSSTTVVDFYMRLRPEAAASTPSGTRERNLIARGSTVVWALVLFAIALYALAVGGKGHVVEIGLSIASVAYGCLLGVFLLGTLTRFATQTGATIGMVCGFALNLWLWQGTFPIRLGPLTIPHIAFTWYVLIGALVTFAIGALASLLFRKPSRQRLTAALVTLSFLGLSFRSAAGESASPAAAQMPAAPDFSPITTLLTDAIAAHKLPGAVVVIGHDHREVFAHAYGNRKLANEPGLDGLPSPAEPMTEDTVFDMASLTKCLATATAVMQLYEQGKIASFDDPVEKYLPAFNPTHDPVRANVTPRMLLTHTSGEAADISLKDPWGLAAPDRAEGFRRALANPLQSAPGAIFRYSDINYILLGLLVETLSGQREDAYASEHIFSPLGMTETRYLPLDKACGPHRIVGAALVWAPKPPGNMLFACPAGTWSTSLLPRIAPTTHDDESKPDPAANPHFDMLTRGTVHDPTTRRMGGVAGQAGVFSTAHDMALFAQALLDKLTHNTGPFPLKQSTLQLMTQPEQPGRTPNDLLAANAASHTVSPTDPLLAAAYPAIKGRDLRGFGWDIDTAFSKPRGRIFPIGSFGHTGFTGTSLWMDPASNTYVILLANAIHPRGNPPISALRGDVATAAALALGLSSCPSTTDCHPERSAAEPKDPADFDRSPAAGAIFNGTPTLTGIDVLEATHFAALTTFHHIGLLTNQTGRDAQGHRTIDVLLTHHQPLTTLFSPEHGINGALDREGIASSADAATGLPVISLYGSKPADRHPTHDQLKDLDAVVIDLQDAGVHFWTYEAAAAYFLEAAAKEASDFQHRLEVVVLDRPNPIGGLAVQGPVSDPGRESYVNYMPLPVRHGMTLGELLTYINQQKHLNVALTVVRMQHWQRADFFADTGLPWVNPSPNLRSPEAAILYPALGLIETTNVSVGRGTDAPFSFFGAGLSPGKKSVILSEGAEPHPAPQSKDPEAAKPAANSRALFGDTWFRAADVVATLNARHIPGVTFAPTRMTIADDQNHYPYHGQTIDAVRVTVTDPTLLNTPELGIEILSALHKLYPTQFKLASAMTLLANQSTMDALTRGDDPRDIARSWQPALTTFNTSRAIALLYP